jgi:hypothetical protein
VMITAHGAAPSVVRNCARGAGREVEAYTVPVTHAHHMLDRLVALGYFPGCARATRATWRSEGWSGTLKEVRGAPGRGRDPKLAGRARIGCGEQTTQPVELVLDPGPRGPGSLSRRPKCGSGTRSASRPRSDSSRRGAWRRPAR